MEKEQEHLYNGPIMVSVCCTAYNHAKYIRHTLEGFVRQVTNFRYEVVVHDDASTDGTLTIVREYEQKYPQLIKVIAQKENQYSKGVKIIQNIIFPALQGKYLAICEGDDYWCDDHKLQKQFDAMQAHPECSICTHLVKCCNEDGSENAALFPAKSYRIDKTGVLTQQQLADCYWVKSTNLPFQASSYFLRREVFTLDLEYQRDIGYLRKSLLLGSMFYFNTPMSTYRMFSSGSWTSRLKEDGAHAYYDFLMQKIREEESFDKDTQYRYHTYIEYEKCILLITCFDYAQAEARKRIQAENLQGVHFRTIAPLSQCVKMRTQLMLIRYAPALLLFMKKGKRRVQALLSSGRGLLSRQS